MRNRMRYLRSYEAMAQKVHFCDTCCHDIEPGSCYRGSVSVNEGSGRNRVFVYREHVSPNCPVDPFDEDEEVAARAETGKRSVARTARAAA